MTSFIWCEWICGRCGDMHRTRFNLVIGLKAAEQLRGTVFEKEGIFIRDIAFNIKEQPSKKGKRQTGSKVFVKWNTEIQKVFEALRTYMPQFYSIKENSLKMELCRT